MPGNDEEEEEAGGVGGEALACSNGPQLLAALLKLHGSGRTTDGGAGAADAPGVIQYCALVQALRDQHRARPFPEDALTYQNDEGLSPLHAAVAVPPAATDGGDAAGAEEKAAATLVQCLVEDLGAPARALGLRDGRMRSPLLLAAERGNARAFLYLWGRQGGGAGAGAGAGAEEADCFGRTALHWWCKHGRAECVRAVLAAGEEGEGEGAVVVNARTTSAETPLMWALQSEKEHGVEEVVRLLLAAGADARAATTGMDQRPLDLLPPAGHGTAVQERLRALVEAHLQQAEEAKAAAEEEEQEEEGKGSKAVGAPKDDGKASALPQPSTPAAAAAVTPSSLLSFVGKGRGATGAVGIGGVGAGRGIGGGGAPPKKLKIKLKGSTSTS